VFRRRNTRTDGTTHSHRGAARTQAGPRSPCGKIETAAVIASSRARTAMGARRVAGQADDCETQVRVPRSQPLLSVRGCRSLAARCDGEPSMLSQALASLVCSTGAELRAESLGGGVPTGMSATAVVASKPKTRSHPTNQAFRRCAEGVSCDRFMTNLSEICVGGVRQRFLHLVS
jgi:hypothetical protein